MVRSHYSGSVMAVRPSSSSGKPSGMTRSRPHYTKSRVSDDYARLLARSTHWAGQPCQQNPDQWLVETRETEEALACAKDLCRLECQYVDRCFDLGVAGSEIEKQGVWGGWSMEEIRRGTSADGQPVTRFEPRSERTHR